VNAKKTKGVCYGRKPRENKGGDFRECRSEELALVNAYKANSRNGNSRSGRGIFGGQTSTRRSDDGSKKDRE
jgi:hypothetical protein